VRHSPFERVVEDDWTAQAVAALEEDSPRRFAEIDRLPWFMRRPALSFAGTVHSPLYTQLCNGQARYLHFHLTKPPAPAGAD
jgi:hypothetical protein